MARFFEISGKLAPSGALAGSRAKPSRYRRSGAAIEKGAEAQPC
jgi:hypothetical protein